MPSPSLCPRLQQRDSLVEVQLAQEVVLELSRGRGEPLHRRPHVVCGRGRSVVYRGETRGTHGPGVIQLGETNRANHRTHTQSKSGADVLLLTNIDHLHTSTASPHISLRPSINIAEINDSTDTSTDQEEKRGITRGGLHFLSPHILPKLSGFLDPLPHSLT